jgi:hypothetical protein
MPADDDQIFRAREGAEIAGDAKRFTRLRIHVEARRAAITFGDHGPLEGILLGVNIFGGLITESDPHAFEQIDEKNAAQKIFHYETSVPRRREDVKRDAEWGISFELRTTSPKMANISN